MKRWNQIIPGFVATLAIISLIALPALAATADIEIEGRAYHPASLTVESNTTVTWTNYDQVSHTVTSTGGLFDSGPLKQDETFSYTFTDVGTYPYGCTLNVSKQRTPMQGVIIVVPEGGMPAAPDDTRTPEEGAEDITLVDVIAGDENLTILAEAVERANLARTVLSTSGGGPYTVFAPNDAAFEALGNETLAGLFNDTETLDTLLMYHVVEGNYTAEDLAAEVNATGNETLLPTLSGDMLTVSMTDDVLRVENATIVASNSTAGNGIIHIIDRVLMPPENMTSPAPSAEPVIP